MFSAGIFKAESNLFTVPNGAKHSRQTVKEKRKSKMPLAGIIATAVVFFVAILTLIGVGITYIVAFTNNKTNGSIPILPPTMPTRTVGKMTLKMQGQPPVPARQVVPTTFEDLTRGVNKMMKALTGSESEKVYYMNVRAEPGQNFNESNGQWNVAFDAIYRMACRQSQAECKAERVKWMEMNMLNKNIDLADGQTMQIILLDITSAEEIEMSQNEFQALMKQMNNAIQKDKLKSREGVIEVAINVDDPVIPALITKEDTLKDFMDDLNEDLNDDDDDDDDDDKKAKYSAVLIKVIKIEPVPPSTGTVQITKLRISFTAYYKGGCGDVEECVREQEDRIKIKFERVKITVGGGKVISFTSVKIKIFKGEIDEKPEDQDKIEDEIKDVDRLKNKQELGGLLVLSMKSEAPAPTTPTTTTKPPASRASVTNKQIEDIVMKEFQKFWVTVAPEEKDKEAKPFFVLASVTASESVTAAPKSHKYLKMHERKEEKQIKLLVRAFYEKGCKINKDKCEPMRAELLETGAKDIKFQMYADGCPAASTTSFKLVPGMIKVKKADWESMIKIKQNINDSEPEMEKEKQSKIKIQIVTKSVVARNVEPEEKALIQQLHKELVDTTNVYAPTFVYVDPKKASDTWTAYAYYQKKCQACANECLDKKVKHLTKSFKFGLKDVGSTEGRAGCKMREATLKIADPKKEEDAPDYSTKKTEVKKITDELNKNFYGKNYGTTDGATTSEAAKKDIIVALTKKLKEAIVGDGTNKDAPAFIQVEPVANDEKTFTIKAYYKSSVIFCSKDGEERENFLKIPASFEIDYEVPGATHECKKMTFPAEPITITKDDNVKDGVFKEAEDDVNATIKIESKCPLRKELLHLFKN